MEPQPPPYSEATGNDSFPNFCVSCGHKFDHLNISQNQCSSCGTIIVQFQQPMPMSMPIPAMFPIETHPQHDQVGPTEPKHLPVTQQPTQHNTTKSETVDCPSSSSVHFNMHKVINNRLIIDFEKVSCCPWQHVGLHKDVENNIPEEIQSKGISAHQWKKWITELQDIQRLAPSVAGCMCMFCFPGFIVQSTLCAMLCPISMNHPLSFLPCCYGDWYGKLKKWQENVNKTLTGHGMHAKLMTYKPHNIAPRSKLYSQRVSGKDHNYEMSFLVIALTREECEKLMFESWDHGVNDGCTSGIGRIL